MFLIMFGLMVWTMGAWLIDMVWSAPIALFGHIALSMFITLGFGAIGWFCFEVGASDLR